MLDGAVLGGAFLQAMLFLFSLLTNQSLARRAGKIFVSLSFTYSGLSLATNLPLPNKN